ncbi:hypothetical protein CC1G_14882 [Coprinopsis cinerea okayama7|uniref:Uncharacterized protein n=1 Tax=Coprinopsis cinerea (strain Okayama-7 / 130 / ATCC MYA-4618 / FGSC 9003) TaxID=240176 RepID=D6RNJ5_COPC7|nr:hypothetical protein CC1G_14882 [Coprinopsis cinerea okayama7\|eukprot:XP_002910905.1 hypothetical protein CC1G_14882 [Coprinopsis cinerea okayama7\
MSSLNFGMEKLTLSTNDRTAPITDHEIIDVDAELDRDDGEHLEEFQTGGGPVVLILCGLIASGKNELQCIVSAINIGHTIFNEYRTSVPGTRCGRESTASETRGSLLFYQLQRFHWIKIAREFPGTLIWVIVFDTPYEVCVARLHERTNHPTITSIELGLSVLSRFAADFEPPESHEGYDRILYLKPEDHPSALYTRSELAGILERVRDSKPVVAAPPAAAMSSFGGAPPSRGEYGVSITIVEEVEASGTIMIMAEEGGEADGHLDADCITIVQGTVAVVLPQDCPHRSGDGTLDRSVVGGPPTGVGRE